MVGAEVILGVLQEVPVYFGRYSNINEARGE